MRVPRDERFLKGKRVPLYLPSRQIFGGLSFQLYEKTIFVGRDAMKTKLALSISLAALTLGMPGAGARRRARQGEQGAGVVDIVVTAQKRSERLQDVPVAVSSVSGEVLKAANLSNITDIRFLAPSVQFAESNSVRGEGFAIRGVGTFAFADGTEQSVSVVVDGVVLGRPGMGTGDLADIAQVDILRGPQGMLFGKGGSAGVVSISTKNPVQKFEASARASYGTDNETKLEAMVNLPVNDKLAWRVNGYFNHRDGFIKNVSPEKRLVANPRAVSAQSCFISRAMTFRPCCRLTGASTIRPVANRLSWARWVPRRRTMLFRA
jgi:outer membrane receptor protein involved in Fe transport